jgi:hypothetical protein
MRRHRNVYALIHGRRVTGHVVNEALLALLLSELIASTERRVVHVRLAYADRNDPWGINAVMMSGEAHAFPLGEAGNCQRCSAYAGIAYVLNLDTREQAPKELKE